MADAVTEAGAGAAPGAVTPVTAARTATASGAFKPLDRVGIARRIAQDIPEGWFVNLGIGIPTTVSDFVPTDREVIFHAENGVIGIGPAPAPEDINPFLVNAGVQHVTIRTGAAFVHHADSFGIARGGHLDLCVLGAFQVAENGDIANWAHSPDEPVKQVGGAMDLAVGAKRVWVAMEHNTKGGGMRLLERCVYPLTAKGVVQRVYTDLTVLDVTPRGFVVRDMIPGLTFETLQERTGAKLHRPG
jgi:3-oxoadipate CoA-transferase beta subunit